VLALCPPTQLINGSTSPQFSCGVTRQFPSSQRLYAWGRQGANRYQFEFTQPTENYIKNVVSNGPNVLLNWTSNPLLDGRTYNVRVRISKTAGATWCAWGETCLVTIDNGGGSGIVEDGGQRVLLNADEPAMNLYPNPNRGEQVFLNLNGLGDGAGSISVDVYDMFGNQVMARTLIAQDGQVNTMLELPGTLASGMYVVNVSSDGRTWTERMVVQR